MSAATRNYTLLYSRNCYAHAAGSTSFDATRLPRIADRIAARHGNAVLDIGGGSGTLGAALAGLGVRKFALDAAEREAPDFLRLDLSQHDAAQAREALRRIVELLGETYLATCLDVAEHIDIEHLPGFLLNLVSLVGRELLLSVSTRPSSSGNCFHASLLPIETWQRHNLDENPHRDRERLALALERYTEG